MFIDMNPYDNEHGEFRMKSGDVGTWAGIPVEKGTRKPERECLDLPYPHSGVLRP